MTAINLSFDVTGTGTCFYTEAIDLQNIGSLEITRASTIEFNANSQEWEVKDNNGAILYSDPSRNRCLSWEQRNFNQ
jgi:hypothetical protein